MELSTKRLTIRLWEEDDYPGFERTLNDVQKTCMGSGRAFFDWIRSQYGAMDVRNGLISMGIFDQTTGELYGTVGAGRHDDLGETEIFYSLLPEHRGHGYATEAAKAVTAWAAETYDLPYIIGTAGADNVPSHRVLERCGYEFVDERSLLVHVTGARYDFRYYRYYAKK